MAVRISRSRLPILAGASMSKVVAEANLCCCNYLQASKIQFRILILGSKAG